MELLTLINGEHAIVHPGKLEVGTLIVSNGEIRRIEDPLDLSVSIDIGLDKKRIVAASNSLGVPSISVFEKTASVVLKYNDRYFVRFNRKGHALSAWSLPGAKMFPLWEQEDIKKTVARLEKKGYKVDQVLISEI